MREAPKRISLFGDGVSIVESIIRGGGNTAAGEPFDVILVWGVVLGAIHRNSGPIAPNQFNHIMDRWSSIRSGATNSEYNSGFTSSSPTSLSSTHGAFPPIAKLATPTRGRGTPARN
jgi:hypothetical protein